MEEKVSCAGTRIETLECYGISYILIMLPSNFIAQPQLELRCQKNRKIKSITLRFEKYDRFL